MAPQPASGLPASIRAPHMGLLRDQASFALPKSGTASR